jgi:hypothetical protein
LQSRTRATLRGLRLWGLAAVDKGAQSRGDCAGGRACKWADDRSSKAWSGDRAVGNAYAVMAVRGGTRRDGSRSGHQCDRGDNAHEECSHTCLPISAFPRRCRRYMPAECDKKGRSQPSRTPGTCRCGAADHSLADAFVLAGLSSTSCRSSGVTTMGAQPTAPSFDQQRADHDRQRPRQRGCRSLERTVDR